LCGKEPQKWSVAEKGVKRQKDFVNGKKKGYKNFYSCYKGKTRGVIC
jgi:hypothetical protein